MDRFVAMNSFIRVVDTGSFSEAARQLGVGQPSISKSMAQLEEQLGVRLLLRSTRGLTPTEAGLGFYEHAKRAIEAADEAEMAARGARSSLTGRLRVSAAVTFARIHVVPLLPTFLERHQELEIDLILDDRMVDLVEEGVDIALRAGALADSSATARRLAHGRRKVVGTPAYFERAGVPLTPHELPRHQSVGYLLGLGATWQFNKTGETVEVTLSSRLRTTAAEGVREAVLADFGLTVAGHWMFSPELKSGRVVEVLADWSLPPVDLWAVFPTGRRVSEKARAFAAFVETHMRES
jgi:DNA-binding transcriptional LysR family regulator